MWDVAITIVAITFFVTLAISAFVIAVVVWLTEGNRSPNWKSGSNGAKIRRYSGHKSLVSRWTRDN